MKWTRMALSLSSLALELLAMILNDKAAAAHLCVLGIALPHYCNVNYHYFYHRSALGQDDIFTTNTIILLPRKLILWPEECFCYTLSPRRNIVAKKIFFITQKKNHVTKMNILSPWNYTLSPRRNILLPRRNLVAKKNILSPRKIFYWKKWDLLNLPGKLLITSFTPAHLPRCTPFELQGQNACYAASACIPATFPTSKMAAMSPLVHGVANEICS